MWAFLLTLLLSKRGNCDVVRERTDAAGKKRHTAFPAGVVNGGQVRASCSHWLGSYFRTNSRMPFSRGKLHFSSSSGVS